jgi:large subunit ribosomal protein L25
LHFLTNEPIHADFYQVSMTEKLKAHVALEFIGESPAVKAMGGILVKVMNEIEVQCLPADLPHNIQVDIASLTDFSQAIHIRDLKLGDKVQILANPEEVIAKVQPPRDVEAELAKTADEKSAVEAVVAASEKVKTPEETKDGAEEKTKEEKPKK